VGGWQIIRPVQYRIRRQSLELWALGSAGNEGTVTRTVTHTKFDNPAGQ